MELLNAGGGAADAGAATKQFWSPVTWGTNMEKYSYYPVAKTLLSGEVANVSFHVPDDFSSITEAYLVVISGVTDATTRWYTFSDYAAVGEAYRTHSENNTTTDYNATFQEIFQIDISPILTSLAAGDYVGIQFQTSAANPGAYVLGVMFKYS